MNRTDFQTLALTRLREAEALLRAGEWSGAYYMAGYAIECGLKACITRLTNQDDYPDKERTLRSYSHKPDVLLDTARLKAVLAADLNNNIPLDNNWAVVKDWSE